MIKCIKKSYDVSFKLQVLSDYYLSGKSKNFTCEMGNFISRPIRVAGNLAS